MKALDNSGHRKKTEFCHLIATLKKKSKSGGFLLSLVMEDDECQ